MGQIDASMTQMLLPRLEHDFAAPLSTVSWVAVGYILAMASFMPIFGRLADMFGRKLLYTSSFLVFALGSALCGFAPSLPVLIAFPLLPGIGAAIVFLALSARAERRAETPLIDFQLLRQGAFLIGNVANFLSYAALFGLFFLVPFVLVRAYQDTALAAGLRLSIVPVMLGLLAPLGGALYDRFGARVVTASGMVVCIVGLAVLHVFLDGVAANMPLVMLALAIFGI